MEWTDKQNRAFNKGDIIVLDNGKKYLVIYENSCIAWHFLDLETFKFNVEIAIDISSKLEVGVEIEELGTVAEIIHNDQFIQRFMTKVYFRPYR